MAKRSKPDLFNRTNPPRVINVMGHKIKVRVVKYLIDENHELLGAWNPETKTIFLLKGCDWRSVLFHELIHCVISLSGVGEDLSMSKEESIVLALENNLFPVIR